MSPGIGTGATIFGCAGPVLLPEERAFFREADPFGFILFARNVETPDQLRRLTQDLREAVGREAPILVDQGTADEFLTVQLLPDRLAEACRASATPLQLNMREGYGHGYWFVQTFVEGHLRHHAALLAA